MELKSGQILPMLKLLHQYPFILDPLFVKEEAIGLILNGKGITSEQIEEESRIKVEIKEANN